MANSYKVFNGPMPAAAATPKVTTGTAIKTMLQIVPAFAIELVEWGWSGDLSAAATPGEVELVTTTAVAATVTAYVAADVMKYGDPNSPTQTAGGSGVPLNLGTALSGYSASAEGTVVTCRLFDYQQIAGFNQYCYQFPLAERPVVAAAEVLRIRNTFGAAVNAVCYVLFKPAS